MQRRTFFKIGIALLLVGTACMKTSQVADNSPAAKTPVLTSLSSVVPRTCAWTTISPNAAGSFELLPSGHPSGDIRVVFRAPYPSKIAVNIDDRFFLREPDNTQVPGEGYYKINAITLSAAKDTFDWDVTVTPPASQRVEPGFRLNIANVSINPAFSGADKRSAPLALQFTHAPVADLTAWLAANTRVRDAIVWEASNGMFNYSSWTAQDKQFLLNAFAAAWTTNFLLLEDPPRNAVTLADSDPPLTVIAEGDAWWLYITHIAYNLAAEMAGWTSWSITTYSTDELALLFDSREMFRWSSADNGYKFLEGTGPGGVVPASPWTTLLFLYQNDIYTCRSRLDVIDRMLDWSRRNLAHFSGGFEAKNMQDQWQYRGVPPALRIMQGTPFPDSGVPSFSGILHRTAGCWGTTAYLRAMLRVLNIPVKHEDHAGHAMPYFITEGLYLSHGDDPYSRLSKATPPFPARELLIDQATRDAWFGAGVSNAQQDLNVGRRTRDLAIKYLSNELLHNHCADLAANKAHADSDVFNSLKSNYTVAELEGRDLWGRIDAKITSLGGCTLIP
jgi:hypothetical protein